MKSFSQARCPGCGAVLQNQSPTTAGYTPKKLEDAELCQRCFQLKHYSKTAAKVLVDEKGISALLDSMDFKKNAVAHVVDLLDLQGSVVASLLAHENLYFVVNKVDLLPKGYNAQEVAARIASVISEFTKLSKPKIILASAVDRTGVRKLADLAKEVKAKGKKLYFVGKTNVGKSSLVNQVASYLGLKQRMSVSAMASTTLAVNAIQTRDVALIDTPGVIREDSAERFADKASLAALSTAHGYRQVNFQLRNEQSVIIGGLAQLALLGEKVTGSLTLYVPKGTSVVRAAFAKGDARWRELAEKKGLVTSTHVFTVEGAKTNVVASGLFLASLKGFSGRITLAAPVGLAAYCAKAVI